MNVIGKIIGLIAIALIILLIVNFKTVLPYFDRLATGGTLSPVQIGADYMNQINKFYPNVYAGISGGKATGYTGQPLASTYTNYFTQNGSGISTTRKSGMAQSKVTVEKVGNILSVTTEYLSIPTSLQGIDHIWIANTPTISNATTYIDLGVVKSGGIQTYATDLGPQDISFRQYRYIMIVNPRDFTVYSQSTLQI
jgi:hypothetical protein